MFVSIFIPVIANIYLSAQRNFCTCKREEIVRQQRRLTPKANILSRTEIGSTLVRADKAAAYC